MTEFYVVVGIVILALVVGTLGMLFPVGLGAPADPLDTPLHVKPEWYFLALYQLLKYVPSSILGIEGPMFAVTMMVRGCAGGRHLAFPRSRRQTARRPCACAPSSPSLV